MILKMIKKNVDSDKDPLVICVEHNDKILVKKISIGQSIEVEDELGYVILGKYPKCLVLVQGKETKEKVASEVK